MIELNKANIPAIRRSDPALTFVLSLIAACVRGSLILRLPGGEVLRFRGTEPGAHGEILVKSTAFARRVVKNGDNGFAEGYIAGEWESPNVTAVLEFFCQNMDEIEAYVSGKVLWRLGRYLLHLWRGNSRRQAKRNISAHYDLGNDFYSAWLDRSMTYSSALFGDGDNDLESAQRRKYRAIAVAADIRPDHHVLEIGCGWGGFAEFAAKEIGCRVTGLTISQAQFDYATRRLAEAGLSERAAIKLQDYRDEDGCFDRIVSIEMFEAVGEDYWPVFFSKMNAALAPGGKAGLQVITLEERFFPRYRKDIDFIRRYIFPGGMLPTPSILQQLGQRFGLPVTAEQRLAPDYARTLAEWRRRFDNAWPQIARLGFDEHFKRLWEYYLHYCEAGFRAGSIDVRQVVFSKG